MLPIVPKYLFDFGVNIQMRYKWCFIILCCFYMQHAQVLKYSNAFLDLGTSARALSLSGAVNAGARGLDAAYWNPAGLACTNTNFGAALMHASYYANLANFDYAGYLQKLDSVTAFGVSILRFGIDDIPNTLDLMDAQGNIDYNRITRFSSADYAILATYAGKAVFKTPVRYGISFKTLRRFIGPFANAWGFGIDAGIQISKGGVNFGIMGRDLSGTFNAWRYTLNDAQKNQLLQTGNMLPQKTLEITSPKLIIGFSFIKPIGTTLTIEAECNAVNRFDGLHNSIMQSHYWNVDPSAGIELAYNKLVFFRLGTGQFQKVWNTRGTYREWTQDWTTGLGFLFKKMQLDYALCGIGSTGIGLKSHIFSLTYNWNSKS